MPLVSVRGLRVGLLCRGGLGGSTTAAVELASALARAGADVVLCAERFPKRLELLGWTSPAPGPIRPMAWSGHPSAQLELRLAQPGAATQEALLQAHRERPFDLLHGHFAFPCGEDAAQAAATLGLPWVLGLHGSDVASAASDPARGARLAHLASRATVVVCPSRALAAQAREVLPSGGLDHPLIIPNFIDASIWEPNPDQEPSERLSLLFVGHLEPWKGVDVALHALKVLLDRGAGARLGVLGAGPLAEPSRALADRLGLEDRVVFEGAVTLTPARLARADLLLVPSRREAFGLVALEAMAAGVPVVAHRVGGLEELLGPDGDPTSPGRLVDLAEGCGPEAAGRHLAGAALELGGDAEARRRWTELARARLFERYDLPKGLQGHLELYARVLDRHPA